MIEDIKYTMSPSEGKELWIKIAGQWQKVRVELDIESKGNEPFIPNEKFPDHTLGGY